jgi:hypothetical protein
MKILLISVAVLAIGCAAVYICRFVNFLKEAWKFYE